MHSNGYNPIIGHGGAFEDDMIKVGEEFPDTQFIRGSRGTGAESNVLSVDNAPWQYGIFLWAGGSENYQSKKIGY